MYPCKSRLSPHKTFCFWVDNFNVTHCHIYIIFFELIKGFDQYLLLAMLPVCDSAYTLSMCTHSYAKCTAKCTSVWRAGFQNRHLHINSICINSLALQQSSDNIIKDSRFSVKCYNALGSFI